jgi:hypothetical protein
MSINVAGLPSYNEQDTKKLVSKTIANDKIIKETKYRLARKSHNRMVRRVMVQRNRNLNLIKDKDDE